MAGVPTPCFPTTRRVTRSLSSMGYLTRNVVMRGEGVQTFSGSSRMMQDDTGVASSKVGHSLSCSAAPTLTTNGRDFSGISVGSVRTSQCSAMLASLLARTIARAMVKGKAEPYHTLVTFSHAEVMLPPGLLPVATIRTSSFNQMLGWGSTNALRLPLLISSSNWWSGGGASGDRGGGSEIEISPTGTVTDCEGFAASLLTR
ncbi:hypothetical protein PFLuk1_02434 [Pseudomonas fluorescens]|nr:hypothetical protein PFLuk1_02434 [Pseudomonas fluorescens]